MNENEIAAQIDHNLVGTKRNVISKSKFQCVQELRYIILVPAAFEFRAAIHESTNLLA